ncbi:GNAT family N-acetyltransferase [Plantactinospora sp. WMMB334]|uniref:GNAT family N-acetyltransferase n=1 Tax=Plantactinospora sp. WMMB334 TaxID=3404119 RepID=UPI003B9233F3
MLPWLPEPLDAGRVILRRPAPEDLAGLIGLYLDDEVRRHLGGALDRPTARARAGRTVSEPAWGGFVIVDRGTRELVGSGDLSRKRGPWELSYQLRRASWGQGLASEMISSLVDWFFTWMDDDVLIAVTQDANDRSTRLLERNGARLRHRFEQYGALQRWYEFHRDGRHVPGDR